MQCHIMSTRESLHVNRKTQFNDDLNNIRGEEQTLIVFKMTKSKQPF
jgi:hypothetical protein